MTRPLDNTELFAVAEWLGRVAESIERVTSGLADAIREVADEQRQLRDDHLALSNRLESLTRMVCERTDHLA